MPETHTNDPRLTLAYILARAEAKLDGYLAALTAKGTTNV